MGERWDWPKPHRCDPLGLSVVLVLLLFQGLGNVRFVQTITPIYREEQVVALQNVLAAWNATPNLRHNLDGWNHLTYPCQSLTQEDASTPNWRGVQCLAHDITDTNYSIDIVGLSISNASIVGHLPDAIGDLTWMTTLEVTGNPNLTGALPYTLQKTWLNVLDLHDNGFNGIIPDLTSLWSILQVDLSGNKLTGPYPFDQFRTMDFLQVLNIGGKLLGGIIQPDAFKNKTELETLDISNNYFEGLLPSLTRLEKVISLDVSGNQFKGQLPDLQNLQALRTANFGGNHFTWSSAYIPHSFNLSAKLTMLNLSGNNLVGFFPVWNRSSLGSIRELYLQNNNLSGTLDITEMYNQGLLQLVSPSNNLTDELTENLEMMNLSNNTISTVVYDAFSIQNVTTIFKLDGNPYCENYDSKNDGQRCFCKQICFVTPAKTDTSRKVIVIAASCSVLAVVLILLCVVGAILYKNRSYKKYLLLQFSKRFEEFDVKPTIFSYSELKIATRDFHDDVKLGQGGYGAVYKGVLPNGNVVAVKQLFIKTAQGLDEFSNEVVLITGMKHRNLVNLKGCCLREHQRLLVYEYVDNYDVDQILLGSKKQVVNWAVRLRICLGIARGLHYLHELAHPRVIHRDIKASNILLDKNMEPKIADFGLALLFPDEQSHIMTIHVAGTKGYLAPEYASLGQLSDKVDVYSFGVLCLEIISGRRNIDESFPLDQMYLSKWAWQLHKQNRVLELVDRTMQVTDNEERDLQRVINLSLLCIQNAPEARPSMARIVSVLQGDMQSEVQVVGEGKEQALRLGPGLPSQRSLNYRNYSGNYSGLESVSEEDGSSSSGKALLKGKSPWGPSDGVSVAVELSAIQAR